MKRHLLTNSFLPFPQDRKTLTFYLQEQGDNTRSIVIMWSSPNKRLKTESMCAGSGVTDPSSHSTSSDLQGLVSDLYSGDSQPPTMLPVLENVWGLINRTAAALTFTEVHSLHLLRGASSRDLREKRHPPSGDRGTPGILPAFPSPSPGAQGCSYLIPRRSRS